ncbi:MAG: beta-ketoacyl synthase N-terminal-like domain-containing protein, partial [Burkholderiales bacterium]
MLWWHKQTRLPAQGVKTLQFCAVSFDFSFHEIFATLCLGGTLVLVAEETRRNGVALAEFIRDQAIEKLFLPVTALLQLAEAVQDGPLPACLREVITTGELLQITPAIAHLFRHTGAMLHNHYGATEFQDATTLTLQGDPAGWPTFVPVGRPLQNVQAYILDEQNEPVAVGEEGEFCIGGVGVARGYLNRPELNQQKFIPNPFGSGLLYKTGDLARYQPTPNGYPVIEHLGRMDQQVKIRGFRVELGEIEAALRQHPDVLECAVVAREAAASTSNWQQLVGYFVPAAADKNETIGQLERELWLYLQAHLPDYMVPTRFVRVETMPLTPSGKLDRRALPAPVWTRPALATALVNPGSTPEQRLARIWRQLLGLEEVGIHDNFFELGGTSLLLTQLHKAVDAAFSVNLSAVALFQYPTIHTLARHLADQHLAELTHESHKNGQPSASARPHQAVRKSLTQSGTTMSGGQDAGIAIIGLAGRFPGAQTIEQFWQNLCEGVESISFFSDEELEQQDASLRRHPDYVKAGGVLTEIKQFDAAFFGYSPKEAAITDPQQRILLECAWEAFECAGYNPESYPGLVGVYAGSSMSTYLLNNVGPSLGITTQQPFIETDMAQFQAKIGNDRGYLATRISYKLNLKGPSINVQTACSTSLVAVHLACQSLLTGECDMALAGGVSVVVPHKGGYLYEDGMVRSPDGHCRAFDAEAQGTLFGNGAGLVLLKRLPEALADHDQIIAVIKGTAINNDGEVKVGYTAPSVSGQATAISEALRMAEVDASTIGYVETHGTATKLGDPIEIAALTQAFARSSKADSLPPQRCAIGSVKTNIGHLDEAAGIAGLIKTALALQHKQIPPSLHFAVPNPAIDFVNSPFYVNTKLADWPRNGKPRRAGVSSFGVGGTNSHIVLEEAPLDDKAIKRQGGKAIGNERSHHLLALSARTPKALQELAQRYIGYCAAHPDTNLADLCFTANTGRKHFAQRVAVVADSTENLGQQLQEAIQSIEDAPKAVMDQPKIAFLFTGHGAQYLGMSRELYQTQPIFRQIIDRCDEIIRAGNYLDCSLRDILYAENTSDANALIDRFAYAQPALFALEYALAQLWISWGITPDVVMGHSAGEYAAACVAGVFSLEDGLKLMVARGRLMQNVAQAGEMAAVAASEAYVATLLQELAPTYKDLVTIAAINGPESVVISGVREALEAICETLRRQAIKYERLAVPVAAHSPLMRPVLNEFGPITRQVRYATPTITLISNVTGEIATSEVATAEYWSRHLLQPVRFAQG